MEGLSARKFSGFKNKKYPPVLLSSLFAFLDKLGYLPIIKGFASLNLQHQYIETAKLKVVLIPGTRS